MTAQQQRELERGLRALAGTTQEMKASAAVEEAVLARMGSAARHGGASHDRTSQVGRETYYVRTPASPNRLSVPAREGWSRVFVPVAAALILFVGGAVWTARNAHAPAVVHPTGFVALPGAVWLPQMESGMIVRISLPVTALPAYGVPIQPDVNSDAVLADLLVAQDGQPRAIRLVSDSD